MSKGKVISEMSPKEEPRKILTELARDGGAYIIACGRDSTSDSMRTARLEGMQEVLERVEGGNKLFVDFYDSNRIATWVRKHPSLILWVRNALGRPISGWQSYQNWAHCPGGIEEEYLFDDSMKVRDGVGGGVSELTAEGGLSHIRTILAREKESIRLAGLSGVGKTRFVQALFDPRVGKHCLAQSSVCYTDIADEPIPTPIDMAHQLVAFKKKVVLIVDNCPPNLHSQLTKVCSGDGSRLSLLTVEYDIKEDLPENTDVFYMDPSSNDLLVKLILERFSLISQNEAERIAEFSEGNARIAIAIAGIIKRGESVVALKDETLFKRLFWQRNDPDKNLLRAAEAFSVVYSFDGENISPQGELSRLGSLVGLSVEDLYRHAEELSKRGLLQKRGKWRAVLPQAISNRLAKQALENIPIVLIEARLDEDKTYRLLKSFSNRLGFLHDSSVAEGIAERWLSEGGLLGDIANFGYLEIDLFSNIAPVNPKVTLEAIERAAREGGEGFTSRKNRHHQVFVRLLRRIAYDPNLFERCCLLLLRFVAADGPTDKNGTAQEVLSTLFYIHYSGTHASLEQRLGVISLCTPDESQFNWISEHLLNAALQTSYFRNHYEFKFGAHSRDYGAFPRDEKEVHSWYSTVLRFAQELAVSSLKIAPSVRNVLADRFRGLWWNAGIEDELISCAEFVNQSYYWESGWIAVRQLLCYGKKELDDESKQKLAALEKRLAPNDLKQLIKAYAFTGNRLRFDLAEAEDEDYVAGYERVAKKTEDYGKELAKSPAVFDQLLLEMLTSNSNRMLQLGYGLGMQVDDPAYFWNSFKFCLSDIPVQKRSLSVVIGFLLGRETQDGDWVQQVLDEAVTCAILSPHFPAFQCGISVDKRGAERLAKSLNGSFAPISEYGRIAYSSKKLDDTTLGGLLELIMNKADGESVALDILSSRIELKKELPLCGELKRIGQRLSLQMFKKEELSQMDEYHLRQVVEFCYLGSEEAEAARMYCREMRDSIDSGLMYDFQSGHLVNPMLAVQPLIVLDELLLGSELGARFFSRLYRHREYALSAATVEVVVEWCEIDPEKRFPLVAEITPLFISSNNQDSISISPLAKALMTRVPNGVSILSGLGAWVHPTSWSGSLSVAMAKRVPFIEELLVHEKESVRQWAAQTLGELKADIEDQRKREEERHKQRYGSFE